MTQIEEDLLKLDLLPEDVTDPALFLEKIHSATTPEEFAEARKLIRTQSLIERLTTWRRLT